jgi:hypothetical protein
LVGWFGGLTCDFAGFSDEKSIYEDPSHVVCEDAIAQITFIPLSPPVSFHLSGK